MPVENSKPQFHVDHLEKPNGIAVVAMSGRLMQGPDGAQVEANVKNLLGKGLRKILLDLSGVTHIDSTGIGRTIAALNLVMEAEGDMAVAGAKGAVREAFRVTQLDRVFRFYDDVPAAEASLAAGSQ